MTCTRAFSIEALNAHLNESVKQCLFVRHSIRPGGPEQVRRDSSLEKHPTAGRNLDLNLEKLQFEMRESKY